ncbi:hypothetical protein I546_5994 [Mycobacterium kansasii 732]|nr:hypothetical protein I546_5994 [Mycobacterium kansasii 732]
MVFGRQLRQHRQQTLVQGGGVEVGQQHHQRPAPGPQQDCGNHCPPIRFDERRLQRRHRVDQLGQQFGARRAENGRPAHPVMGQEVDVVAGPRRQRSQKQRGIHRPVQPGPSGGIGGRWVDTDAPRRHPPGVEHQHHPPVPLGPPGAHHHVGATGRRAPVDRADVVADDIFAQRIEFGALPADQRRQQPVDLAEFGQPRRQVFARQKRRQHPDLAGHRLRTLPSRQAQRPERSGGDSGRALVAAANRPQSGRQLLALTAADVDLVAARFAAGAGRPGVADLAAEPAAALVVDGQARVRGLAEPDRAVRGAGEAQPAGAGRQRDVDHHSENQHRQQDHESPCRPRGQRDRQDADQRQQSGASGQCHRRRSSPHAGGTPTAST